MRTSLEAQTPIHFEAASCEEVVFENESDRPSAGDARDVDDDTGVLEWDHSFRRLACAEKHAGEVDVDNRLPLRERHLSYDFPVFGFNKHRVTDDACVVHEAVHLSPHHLLLAQQVAYALLEILRQHLLDRIAVEAVERLEQLSAED